MKVVSAQAIVVVATLTLLVGFLGGRSTGVGARPIMRIGSKSIDFGEIRPGHKSSRELVITNDGNWELMVSRIQVSCGCIEAVLDEDRFAPGQSRKILVTAVPKEFPRIQHHTITIYSNDPGNPSATVPVELLLPRDEVAVHPKSFDFGPVIQSTLPVHRPIRVGDPLARPQAAPIVSKDDPYVDIKLSAGGQGVWSGTFELLPNSPAGDFAGEISVTFPELSNGLVRSISYHGSIRGAYFAEPASVSMIADQKTSITIRPRDQDVKAVVSSEFQVSENLKPALDVTLNSSNPDVVVLELRGDRFQFDANRRSLAGYVVVPVLANGDVDNVAFVRISVQIARP